MGCIRRALSAASGQRAGFQRPGFGGVRGERRARKLGVQFSARDLGKAATQDELHAALDELSHDNSVHGIMLELPLAPGLDAEEALLHVAHQKDIEGLAPGNLALIAAWREPEALLPPTPRSVRFLLRSVLGDDLRGVRAAVIGPGRTVGRPLTFMLNNRGVTVTLCNEHTRELTFSRSGRSWEAWTAQAGAGAAAPHRH